MYRIFKNQDPDDVSHVSRLFLQSVLDEVNGSLEPPWLTGTTGDSPGWYRVTGQRCWLLNKNGFRTTFEVILWFYDMFWYPLLQKSLRITDHRYIRRQTSGRKAGLNSASQRRFRKTMCSNRGSCAVSVGSIWMWTAMTSTRGTFQALKTYCDMFIIWYVYWYSIDVYCMFTILFVNY